MRQKFSSVCAVWAAILGGSAIAALLSVAVQPAAAQDTNPMPAISDYVGAQSAAPSQASPQSEPGVIKPPSYCKPCLYYSGDFDSAGPTPNALTNENDVTVHLSQIFTPFTVPSGKKWKVTGLFINSLPATGVQDPQTTGWSIWTGVSAGVSGTLFAAGAGKGKLKPTGRSGFGLTEYTTSVKASVTLPCGTYWVNVLPQCTNPSDTNCSTQRIFESDVEDASPAEHYGPANLVDDSFVNSNFFGFDYTLTTAAGGCVGVGCDLFSFGVIGTATSGPKC